MKEHDAHQLTIFHLMGQHVDYRGRFPVKTRRKFTPADYPDKKLAPKRLQINADYDNAVLYNDSIVDEIIRRFEHQNAIVIYMPDHGEECFNSMDYFGRNHSATIDYRLKSVRSLRYRSGYGHQRNTGRHIPTDGRLSSVTVTVLT